MIFNTKKVQGVDATLKLKIGPYRKTLVFGKGSEVADTLEFTVMSFLKKKPVKASGLGHGILAFKQMVS